MGNKTKFLELLFLPFFIINLLITMLKKKEETSSRLLYFVELETLKNSGWHWDFLYELFRHHLVNVYSPEWPVWSGYKQALVEVFKIYFKNENHPINELARRL